MSLRFLLLLAGSCFAGPVLEFPAEIKVRSQLTDEYYRITPTRTDAKEIAYVALDDMPPFPSSELRDSRKMIVLIKKNTTGRYRFRAIGTLNDELTVARFDLVVGDQPVPPFPVPPFPVPPEPKPPIPPEPPGPSPPIPGVGLQVLMVYEQSELAKMPAGQYQVLYSKNIRDYLNAKCVVGPDGKTRQWRAWDKDTNATDESKLWQDALARPRTRTPWIVISNGKTGYEGPLPTSVEEALKLLQTYGGES